MSVRYLGVVAVMAAMGLVACGDDSGGAGGSGGSGSGGATATGTGGGTTTATGTGGGTTTATGTGGGGTGGEGTGGEGGAASTAPCAAVCAADAGCDESPANPDGACSECVQAEGDQGTDSECAVEGALGPCCQDDPDCSEYVTCVLSAGETCDADFPEGAGRASECVLSSCGDCGTPG